MILDVGNGGVEGETVLSPEGEHFRIALIGHIHKLSVRTKCEARILVVDPIILHHSEEATGGIASVNVRAPISILAKVQRSRVASHAPKLVRLQVERTRKSGGLGPRHGLEVQGEQLLLRLRDKVQDAILHIDPFGIRESGGCTFSVRCARAPTEGAIIVHHQVMILAIA